MFTQYSSLRHTHYRLNTLMSILWITTWTSHWLSSNLFLSTVNRTYDLQALPMQKSSSITQYKNYYIEIVINYQNHTWSTMLNPGLHYLEPFSLRHLWDIISLLLTTRGCVRQLGSSKMQIFHLVDFAKRIAVSVLQVGVEDGFSSYLWLLLFHPHLGHDSSMAWSHELGF